MFPVEAIKHDCRYYTGYKPCGKAETCVDCSAYAPQGVRVLILKLASMGDVLRTTAILPGLAKLFDRRHVTWVTAAESWELLQEHPSIDRLLAFSAETLATVQAEEFDLLLNFEKNPAACSLANLARAKIKKGFCHSPCGALAVVDADAHYALQLGLDDELKFRLNEKTYPEISYEMAGMTYAGEEYELALSPAQQQWSAEFRQERYKRPGELWVGVHTGCGRIFATKQWTLEGFAVLIEHLYTLDNVRVVLFGGQLEKSFNAALVTRCRSAYSSTALLDAGCDNSLARFCALVDACDLMVCTDTLAMHVAIALRKRVVAFFGSTSAAEIDLFGRGRKIVTDFDCAPCYLRECDQSPTCMDELDPVVVFDAVQSEINILRS